MKEIKAISDGIVRTYGGPADFHKTFGIYMQFRCAHAIERCFTGTAPKLEHLYWTYPEAKVDFWLKTHLIDLCEYSGVPVKMDDRQIYQVCEIIKQSYNFLNAAEICLFFYKFKDGKLGTFYGYVDPMVIMSGLNRFLQYRLDKLMQYEREKRAIEMDRKRDEWAAKAVPMPENLLNVKRLFEKNGIKLVQIEEEDTG